MPRVAVIATILVLVVVVGGCSARPETTQPPGSSAAEATSSDAPSASAGTSSDPSATHEPVALIAAGDIAACDRDGDSQTAALVETIDGTVATLGDSVYPSGTEQTFAECYDPTWGAFLDRTRPAIGNHDLEADGGAAYHAYFGERAGELGEWWYSYDIGAWHVVVLNSNCELIECGPGSAQHDWLVDDLANSRSRCTVAYMHHPLFNSGPHGPYRPVEPLWTALHDAGAELMLAGHEHLYERFAPQTPAGERSEQGMRQLTVGTGGHSTRVPPSVAPNSELIIHDAFGVLVLTLGPDSYEWSFLRTDGSEGDAGSGRCH